MAITKAGWGTASEAFIGRTPLLLVDRQSMNEGKNTIRYVLNIKHKLGKIIRLAIIKRAKIN